jgi:ACS family hexuronate transporter-like MFS transporter
MAIFNSGAAIGSIVAPPIIIGLHSYFKANGGDWHEVFIFTGALGFVWLAAWWFLYDSPETHKWITRQEYRLIKEQDDHLEAVAPPEATIAEEVVETVPEERAIGWFELLTYRQTWSIILARLLVDPVWWLYITWLPLYLNQVHGFDLKQIGLFAWVPFVAADAGSLFGGWLSGHLISRGWSVNTARKAVIVFAACLMPAGIIAAFTTSAMFALVLIAIVLFGFQVWINNVQTLPSDMFPSKAVGSVAGLGGTGAGIGSMIFTFTTGWVTDNFSYAPILIAAGLLAPIGTVVLFALAGNIKRVTLATPR